MQVLYNTYLLSSLNFFYWFYTSTIFSIIWSSRIKQQKNLSISANFRTWFFHDIGSSQKSHYNLISRSFLLIYYIYYDLLNWVLFLQIFHFEVYLIKIYFIEIKNRVYKFDKSNIYQPIKSCFNCIVLIPVERDISERIYVRLSIILWL